MESGNWFDVVRLWIRAQFLKARVDRDLDDELRFHLDQHTDMLVDEGAPREQARRAAHDALGELDLIKQRSREAAAEGTLLALDEWRLSMALPRSVSFTILVTTTVAIGAISGYVISRSQIPLYRSEAVIQVIPSALGTDVIPIASLPLAMRLQAISQTVLSRTRLERIAKELDLYRNDTRVMEELTEDFRSHIEISPSPPAGRVFTVRYTGSDPLKVLKVTQRLAGYVKDEAAKEQERMAQDTTSFLEAQAEEVGRRLQAHLAAAKAAGTTEDRRVKLEASALESAYTKLLNSREEAIGRISLARRQLGEQFVLLDAARLPEKPITPSPLQQTGMGALAGLAAGLVLAAIILAVRLWRRPPPAPQPELAGR